MSYSDEQIKPAENWTDGSNSNTNGPTVTSSGYVRKRKPTKDEILSGLERLPDDWALVAVKDKKPYLDNWTTEDFTPEKITDEIRNGKANGIGIKTGTASGGILAVDHDGASCEALVLALSGCPIEAEALPKTVSFTSGKPGRFQSLYRVPEKHWEGTGNWEKSTSVIGPDGKPEELNFRWNGNQSVVVGVHPDTGSYEFRDGCAPWEIELAECPDWILKTIAERQTQKTVPTKPAFVAPANSQGWLAMSEHEKALIALEHIDPNPLDWYEWRDILLGAHDAGCSELEVLGWSEHSSKHSEKGFYDVWKHIKGNPGRTVATLIKTAQEQGFVVPKSFIKFGDGYDDADQIKQAFLAAKKNRCGIRMLSVGSNETLEIDYDPEAFLLEIPKNWEGICPSKRLACTKVLLDLAIYNLDNGQIKELFNITDAKASGFTLPKAKKETKAEKESRLLREYYEDHPKDDTDKLNWGMFGNVSIYEFVRQGFDIATGHPIDDWISINGQLHYWTGTHYQAVEDGEIKKQIIEMMRRIEVAKVKGDDVILSYPFGSGREADLALETIKTSVFKPLKAVCKYGLNLANGTLLVTYDEEGIPVFTLHPHSRDRIYLRCAPVGYDPGADTQYADTLLRAVANNQLETFLKHQSMFFDYPGAIKKIGRPRAGICEGGGSNGKDSFRKAMESLLGEIGGFSFEEFNAYDQGRKFGLAKMPNFQYSWASENTHKVKLENLKSLLSAIVCNSPMISEYKGRDPEQYYPELPLWFSLNESPITNGASTFITSRFAIYSFDKTFCDDPQGENEIKADPRFTYDNDFMINQVCPGVLLRLIEAYKKLWVEGIDWSKAEGRLKDWAREHNHLLDFADDEGLEPSQSGVISISDLYDELKAWYVKNDFLTVTEFGAERWLDPPSRYDQLVKRPSDLFKRLKDFFPKIKNKKDVNGSVTGHKNRSYIEGLTK
jgi:phage/plasmid-associated DNA primase